MTTEEKLERYADLQERLDFLQKSLAELKDKAIPQEVREKLAEIDAEYAPMITSASDEVASLLENIKEETLVGGLTIKGTRYMAVWNKGRESWDGKKLNGFALAYPAILGAQKVGEPTVTIRSVK